MQPMHSKFKTSLNTWRPDATTWGMTFLKGFFWMASCYFWEWIFHVICNHLGNEFFMLFLGWPQSFRKGDMRTLPARRPLCKRQCLWDPSSPGCAKPFLVHRLHTVATSQFFWSGWLSRWFPTHGQTKDHMYRNILIAWRFEDAPT